MNESDRYKIISEDYADIILENGSDIEVMKNFEGDFINKINDDISLAYIPVDRMTLDSINKFGYYSVPSCYGLLSAESEALQLTEKAEEIIGRYKGSGVLVGFIDTGIDYRHPAFRNKDNTTRILSIWDQSLQSEESFPTGLYYGTEFSKEQIDRALQSPDPLSVVPVTDDIGHGTMMAGIACGGREDTFSFQGIAPEAELVIVKLKPAKRYIRELYIIPENLPCYQENDIITGVEYIYRIASASGKPVVISLGLGNNIADHAGLRISNRFYVKLGENPGVVFMAAAGNEANRRNHYYGDIPNEVTSDFVELHVGPGDPGFMMQFWGMSPNFFWMDVYLPSGDFLVRIPPVDGQTTIEKRGDMMIIADSILGITSYHEQAIIFRFLKPVEGNWTFVVFGSMGDLPRQFHFWLTLHNFLGENTYFMKPNNYTTIVGPANTIGIMTVSSYDTKSGDLFFYSSRGFSVEQYPKPSITAPGVGLLAPYPGNGYVSASGTSMAAAYTAGITALVLQWGIVEGRAPLLNTAHVKRIYEESAVRTKDRIYPDREWGYGILNPVGIIDALRGIF